MSNPSHPNKEQKPSGQRSQRRTVAAVPLQISGKDARGEPFEESTEALNVSRRGLSFLTKLDLPIFTQVTVVMPGRGPVRPDEGPTDFFTTAAVVRVDKEGDVNRVGIRFVGTTLPTYTAETS